MRRLPIACVLFFVVLTVGVALHAAEPDRVGPALSLPDLSWSLEINVPGFKIEQDEIAPRGDAARFMAANRETGVVLSAFLERAAKAGGSKECREDYWSKAEKSLFKKEGIRMYESGPLAVVEYIVPEHLGMKVNQKNVNAYLAEGGYCIDVHISKANFKEENNDLFSAMLKNIRINRDYTPSALDRFRFGSLHFDAKDWKKAAVQYEKALELEKQRPSLDRTMWKVLVVQLGVSYGVSGDLAKAKELFEWAVAQEPEYPMFHYNLACAFAEMGNKERALDSLSSAYKYKSNTAPGESLPDPKEDPSFAEFLKDEGFKAELDRIE